MKERTKLKYELGLNRIKEKLSEMNLEIDTLNKSNPIEHIKYRLKSLDSIKNKLDRKNLEYKDESIEKNINDVIGARIVCPFLSDVNELIERCAIISREDKEKFAKLIFENTTTIGIRFNEMERFKLARREEKVMTRFGEVSFKVSEGFGVTKTKP